MAWTTPSTRSPGEVITADDWNVDLTDNLVYLKARADHIFAVNGQTTGTVTIREAGSMTTCVYIIGSAWNETGNATIASNQTVTRAVSGANMTFTDGVNTITVVFNANGSITASRTAGAVTWGLRLLVIAA
jgi:hypothetical protein